mmetsp:Transcript_27608/g.49945  ORF Transcript_27608/g.49945 Transcript_27608/m.49945 type:complete len:136 (-) Transcript_27608:11-418(-)
MSELVFAALAARRVSDSLLPALQDVQEMSLLARNRQLQKQVLMCHRRLRASQSKNLTSFFLTTYCRGVRLFSTSLLLQFQPCASTTRCRTQKKMTSTHSFERRDSRRELSGTANFEYVLLGPAHQRCVQMIQFYD